MVFKGGSKTLQETKAISSKDLKSTGEVHQIDSCSTEVLNASNWGNEEARSFPQKYNWLIVSVENFQNEIVMLILESMWKFQSPIQKHCWWQSPGAQWECLWTAFIFLIFKLFSACMKVLATGVYMHLVYTSFPQRLKKILEPGNWSHGWLWAAKWVLRTEPWPSSYI